MMVLDWRWQRSLGGGDHVAGRGGHDRSAGIMARSQIVRMTWAVYHNQGVIHRVVPGGGFGFSNPILRHPDDERPS